jgi:secreted PhoX family phosphatase
MAEFTDKKTFDRRGFLKGSALFAAAALGVAATVAPAFAQDAAQTKPSDDPKKPEEKKDDKDAAKGEAKQPAGQTAEKQDPNKLYDKSGREYRVCERCGGNMYQEGNTWTCEQCGLSYSE